MLAEKTVILASDKIELLSRCNIVYVMHNGKIIEYGEHDELVKRNSLYAKLTSHQLRSKHYKRVRNGELASSTPSRSTPTSPTHFMSSCSSSFDSVEDNSVRNIFIFILMRNMLINKPNTILLYQLKHSRKIRDHSTEDN